MKSSRYGATAMISSEAGLRASDSRVFAGCDQAVAERGIAGLQVVEKRPVKADKAVARIEVFKRKAKRKG